MALSTTKGEVRYKACSKHFSGICGDNLEVSGFW